MSETLAGTKRLIVKIGSSLLIDEATGELRRAWLEALIEDAAQLRQKGSEVLIVTSGAVGLGRRLLKLPSGPLGLEAKQAAAAVGQIRLAHIYQETAALHGITVAQILLTPEDTEERRRHLNARATLEQLLALKALPVINENDTVATAEIRFGDNDRLAARVAQMISADTLVLLSDIDGLYTADPRRGGTAAHVPEIREITPAVEAMAGRAAPGDSSGGMVTKLGAARIALAAGCRMVIAKGDGLHPLAAIDKGARVSWFLPSAEPLTARKRWIAGAVNPAGSLVVDDGAAAALKRGTSLLPAGIVGVEGAFERGDTVCVKATDGRELARGLSAYSSDDARAIAGHKSGEIEAILGYRGRDEMIHRDDLVVT
ncbi:MAG TPA: glutamate 5-kinase [Stellaceae bacterium]|nr:glutamate 5-kinase [Stellaceae bacterium]